MIKQLIDTPFLKLEKIEYFDSTIRICATIKSNRSKCPVCGKLTRHLQEKKSNTPELKLLALLMGRPSNHGYITTRRRYSFNLAIQLLHPSKRTNNNLENYSSPPVNAGGFHALIFLSSAHR